MSLHQSMPHQLRPIQDLVCPSCFSSMLSAVSVTQGQAKCAACLTVVKSFEVHDTHTSITAQQEPLCEAAATVTEDIESLIPQAEAAPPGVPVVMRIDNVAWVSEHVRWHCCLTED